MHVHVYSFFLQKLEMRQASLPKMKTLDDRSKLIALMIDMISSEELEWQDENDGGSKKAYVTRPLVLF